MPTKTQVTDSGSTITGTLGIYNATEYPILISGPTKYVTLSAGPLSVTIEDISTSGWVGRPDPQPPEWPVMDPNLLVFAVYIQGPGMPPTMDHEFVYVTGSGDDDIVRDFSIMATGRRLWRQETLSYGPGRDGKPVFSGDVAYADQFQDEPPVGWSGWLGDLSLSGEQTWDEGLGQWVPDASAISGVTVGFDQHKGGLWLPYAAATNLKWSGVNMNFSGMSKTYGNPPPGVGGKVTGGVGSLELTYNDTAAITSTWIHGLPLIPDFTRTSVRDRDGNLLNDVRLAGPWRCSDEVPDSRNWSTTP